MHRPEGAASRLQVMSAVPTVVTSLLVSAAPPAANTFVYTLEPSARSHPARGNALPSSGNFTIADPGGRTDITEIPEEFAAEYELLRPIPVEFDNVDGNTVACFREAELSFAGVDPADAREHLMDWICGTHKFLTEEITKDPTILGPIPTRQLAVLETYLRRRD